MTARRPRNSRWRLQILRAYDCEARWRPAQTGPGFS